ncbi:MAG: response regulator transcription factor [Verrucomicrobiota bacterium]|nr:response regulator transcription factor [Verrucomicrobiota bacterium]
MSLTKKNPVRVLLVDDSEVVRVGLRALFEAEPAISIVGEAGSVASAVETCAQVNPDVVLMDIRLPDGTGLEACRHLLEKNPAARVLILTSVIEEHMVDEALRAGAQGYLLKEVKGRGLVQAILDVAEGKSVLDPNVTARVIQIIKSGSKRDLFATLSHQEHRVLTLLADGLTNKEIGARLGLTEKTVKNYLASVFSKLGVSRRAQAAVLYAETVGRRG